MRVLIVGCGYVGLRLGQTLVSEGHEVFGLRRTSEAAQALKEAGIQALRGDITLASDLALLPTNWDWVVNVVSSSHGGVEGYREAYLCGNRNLVEWLALTPPRKFVYTSSTSVYGQTDGSSVKESSPTEPFSPTAQVLVETENLLLKAAGERGFPAVILRVAGIYGPGRGYYFKQFLKNEAKIPGNGGRILNMIHLEDVVGVIIAALKNGRAGEIYNAVDEEPVAQVHFYRWLAETLGKWMPPFVPEDEAEERKRGSTNKKVQNRKLKMELGYQFKYPTFRQGYTAEIQRLEEAGELNLTPEPR